MSTFDHVLTFADEDAAHAVLSQIPVKVHERLAPAPVSDGELWNGGCVSTGFRLYIPGTVTPATYDENGNELTPEITVTPEVVLPGFHVGITTVERSAEIEALPACRAVRDRETGAMVYVAADVNPVTLAQVHMSPTFAGIDRLGGDAP